MKDAFTKAMHEAEVVEPAGPASGDERESPTFAANPNYRPPKLHTIDPITLAGKQPQARRWVVPDWIPDLTVTMLAGDGGTGKSLLVQQLMTAVSTGSEWLGKPVKPCRVLAIFCEDDADELHRRQVAINESLGVEMGDLENARWSARVGESNALMFWDKWEAAGAPTEIFQMIHDAAQDFGAQLVILDSLHDLFAGNENSRPHARQFIHLLASLARDCDGAVLLCAHPSVAGRNTGTGEAGSTAWNNAVRSRLYLTREKGDDGQDDPERRVLSRMKANYAGMGDKIALAWRDGVFAPDLQFTGTVAGIERRNAETVFLDLLRGREKEDRPVSDRPRAGNYAPNEFAKRPRNERQGFAKKDFALALERLFSDGRIRLENYGPPSAGTKKIIEVAQLNLEEI